MGAELKWKGDALYLGATKMAEVRRTVEDLMLWEYSIGPDDTVSAPYLEKDNARGDCELHVRDLLVKAGA